MPSGSGILAIKSTVNDLPAGPLNHLIQFCKAIAVITVLLAGVSLGCVGKQVAHFNDTIALKRDAIV